MIERTDIFSLPLHPGQLEPARTKIYARGFNGWIGDLPERKIEHIHTGIVLGGRALSLAQHALHLPFFPQKTELDSVLDVSLWKKLIHNSISPDAISDLETKRLSKRLRKG